MPFISVIVPVYAVQGYLSECLDSILHQSFTDIELIAVDDKSPDHSGVILDEHAERDHRLRVLHLPDNVGLGRARNAGLTVATGDYVWFVDSDDWIAPGALSAIARKVTQLRPDVLIVDHDRVNWFGRHYPSEGRTTLADADDSTTTTLAERPELLNVLAVAWNKIIRREYLRDLGVRFYAGWYEDVPFSYPVLVGAGRVAALGQVCYHYRKRRQDAITHTSSERHFEIFDQWSRVFDHLDHLGEPAEALRPEIFSRMLWHLFVVQSRPDRLPARSRRAFFHQMSEHYHRYRPESATVPEGRLDRLRHRLLAADAYRSFRTLRLGRITIGRSRRRSRKIRRTTKKFGRQVVRLGRTALGRVYYHVQRMLPLRRDLAVFAAYWYRGYSCNPAAIYESVRDLAPSVRPVWIVEKKYAATMPDGVQHVVAGTLPYYRTLARARWLINNVNFPDFMVKRRGSVHLQTHHGTPVKVMGLDQAMFPVGAQDLDFTALLRRCDRWDYSVSANPHSTQAWSRAYPAKYETLEYGYPRNDRLARATTADVRQARAQLGIDPDATVVLYAPTHREYHPGFRPLLNVEELADALGPHATLLLRVHYFYAKAGRLSHPAVRDVSGHPCVEDLLLAADVLITDYSSVMFDYAVLDRPIVIYAPDWDAYRLTRGVTFDLIAQPPGLVATTFTELATAFATGAVTGPRATTARERFRERFCARDDGLAADRVVRHVFADVIAPPAARSRAAGEAPHSPAPHTPAPPHREFTQPATEESTVDEPAAGEIAAGR